MGLPCLCYNRGVNYEESVQYMSGLLLFGERLGRERLIALLARLGDPHQGLRCVHVAGTNGKGSTTTFVASILRSAGRRVGLYLSPYVFDLRERIQIDGKMIPCADFARWVSVIRPHIEDLARTPFGQITEFELKTAVAFCFFAEQGVDYAVLEVGLGGRLDATNVIPAPPVAVITHIGLDHTSILGDTLGKIAGEKAGILKPGSACVTAVSPGEALDRIAEIAAERGCPLHRVAPAGAPEADGSFVTYAGETDGALTITLPETTLAQVRPGLRGPFQRGNAATAAAAIAVLRRRDDPVSDQAIRTGLERAALPGRFQIVFDGADGGPALVLDGAHNPDGAEVLAEALAATFPGRRIVLVIGTRNNHDPEPFLAPLAPLVHRVVATAPLFRPKPAAETAAAAERAGLAVQVVEPAAAAIAETWEAARPGEVVVVTGSFYVVGETPRALRGAWSGADDGG